MNKRMNQQEFIEFSKVCGTTDVTQERIDFAKEHKTSVSCYYGNWNPTTEEFREWGVTPSSEDKGFNTY